MPLTFQFDTSTLAGMVRASCLLEAAARKAGNVHPWASFADLRFDDFVRSADVVTPVLERTSVRGICETILAAVKVTRESVATNTNLGIVLLQAPICAAPLGAPLTSGAISRQLDGLTIQDTAILYDAIRHAQPGGMGEVQDQDLSATPQQAPVAVMSLASERDLIARQWSTGYSDILSRGVPQFLDWVQRTPDWEQAIVGLQLSWLAEFGDSLITRKLGGEAGIHVTRQAQEVLDRGWPEQTAGWDAFEKFDYWLRENGHRRNPGTTADIIAAILLVAMRDATWTPPESITLGESTWGPAGSGFA